MDDAFWEKIGRIFISIVMVFLVMLVFMFGVASIEAIKNPECMIKTCVYYIEVEE